MSLDKISIRIKKDAEQEANQIIEKAKKQAQSRKEEVLASAKKQAQAILDAKKKEAAEEHRRIIANAKLKARKVILDQKRQLVDSAFYQAKSKLDKLKQEHYMELMVRLIEENARGGEEIIMSKDNRESLGGRLIEFSKLALANKNQDVTVTLADDSRDIGKGFILYKDGIELNFSFQNLIESARHESEPQIIKELFKDGLVQK